MKHPSSDLKMVVCHHFCLLSTFINKQDPASIKIDHIRASQHILLSTPTRHNCKISIEKEKCEELSRALGVHLVKYDNIPSSKATKSHVKLIIYMNKDN